MSPDCGNLFADLPTTPQPEELLSVLAQAPGVRIERIVSTGQQSPPGFWYDQSWPEWVVLLSGSAVLRYADRDEPVSLVPGDWMLIAAHRRHRVEATAPDRPSVWLAVHFEPAIMAAGGHDAPQ